ncbi:uncharacterized protein (TIGR03790 family) [Paucibacter oligotrophus]|uniref:Uncharacterized protein (TIGR03790 family) n=1 Tax=Roseateles oligotrophus TaxID=1769250 RepID=A0A840LBQ1_9BURK|nr:uncharacterized protein (TIGR03790 family) [Roseateles oligotrophus]
MLVLSLAAGSAAWAQAASAPVAPSASAPPVPAPAWQRFARLQGRITAAQLGLVINSADPYSVAVGEYYAARRNIPEAHILRVSLPLRATLDVAEFEALQAQIKAELGPEVQALALAWTQPYAVACNSITSALALGFQPDICKNSCAPSQPSPYFNYFGAQPFSDLGLRPAMLLAARSVDSGKALIERGIAADHSLPGFSPANAYFVSTSDTARNVRASLFPPAGRLPGVNVQPLAQQALPGLTRTLIYQTGQLNVPGLEQVEWLPGALADHLTSFGGQLERRLDKGNVQMSALDWLEAGATASYGTVSEPCNHRQKFPHPQFLLLAYLQGVSALEAYWHSVLWPGQGVFIGEPLAAPFSRAF